MRNNHEVSYFIILNEVGVDEALRPSADGSPVADTEEGTAVELLLPVLQQPRVGVSNLRVTPPQVLREPSTLVRLHHENTLFILTE